MDQEHLFWQVHSGLPREAPGSDACTRQALSHIVGLPARPAVLDVGCGPGGQTLVLAEETGGSVMAIDTHEPFLEQLRATAAERGLAGRIEPVNCPMQTPPVDAGSLDLVWSEGAIYIMGFDEGLRFYRDLLTPGGWMAVTELTWLADGPPAEAEAFWRRCYPAMRTAEANVRAARSAGFKVVSTFALPESAWWDSYYGPMEMRLAELRSEHAGDERALAFLDAETDEIEVYRRYSKSYGYVFYILQRPA